MSSWPTRDTCSRWHSRISRISASILPASSNDTLTLLTYSPYAPLRYVIIIRRLAARFSFSSPLTSNLSLLCPCAIVLPKRSGTRVTCGPLPFNADDLSSYAESNFSFPAPFHCFPAPLFLFFQGIYSLPHSCGAVAPQLWCSCLTVVVQLPHSCGATKITEKKTEK